MSPESIFQICSGLAFLGWVILLFASPFWFQADKFLVGILIVILCIVYTWLILGHFKVEDTGKFGSLEGVMSLFTDKWVVTAGWVHYLAFDLFVGTWVKRNSLKYNIPHLLVVPCLLFTFMLGPIGLLLYLMIRWARTRQYFADNY